eukprot:13573395-Alexandrium_andersonii.AAC.1
MAGAYGPYAPNGGQDPAPADNALLRMSSEKIAVVVVAAAAALVVVVVVVVVVKRPARLHHA